MTFVLGQTTNGDINGFKRTCLPHPKELELPFYVSTFGVTVKEPKIDWKESDKCYLVYSLKGCGQVFIDGNWKKVPEGSLMFFPSRVSVRYESVDETPWSTAWISFSGKFSESILPQKTCVIGGDNSFVYD